MKTICLMLLFLIAALPFTSYDEESNHILVGQKDDKVVFLLEVVGNDFENNVIVTESGEVYLKADKILTVPKEALMNFVAASAPNTSAAEGMAQIDSGKEAGYCQRGHDLCSICALCHKRGCYYYVTPCWQQ